MRTLALVAASLIASIALVACASAQDTAPSPAANAVSTESQGAVEKLKGTFAFSLAESEVAQTLRDKCMKAENKLHTADTCYKEIEAEAAKEGIRFSRDAAGHVVWTSYGEEDGHEVVFLEFALDTKSEGNKILGKLAADPRGIHASRESRAKWDEKTLEFEVVSDDVVAMRDPRKGRLVFRKASGK